jgi:hypothetical protein
VGSATRPPGVSALFAWTAAKIRRRHDACFRELPSSSIMSQRAHFWIRIAGLVVILAAEFAPRLWNGPATQAPTSASVTAALR